MAEEQQQPAAAELGFLEKNPFVGQLLGYAILAAVIAVGVYAGIRWAHRSL
jgi:hypothetical protein